MEQWNVVEFKTGSQSHPARYELDTLHEEELIKKSTAILFETAIQTYHWNKSFIGLIESEKPKWAQHYPVKRERNCNTFSDYDQWGGEKNLESKINKNL